MKLLIGVKGTYQVEQSDENGLLVGHQQSNQKPVCAKRIRYNREEFNNSFQRFSQLNHIGLNKYIEIVEYEGKSYAIREYQTGTSLKKILSTRSLYHKISEDFLIETAIHILNAINALHQSQVLHLDIKPANIIIRHEEDVDPKEWKPEHVMLTDFEQAICLPISATPKNRFTLVYSPQEQLLNRMHLLNPSSDLSAVGIVLYEMIAGSPPYVDCNAEIVLNLQLTYPIKKRPSMREEFFDIIRNATHKECFPKHYMKLDNSTINTILMKGINSRYQNANEMIEGLKKYQQFMMEMKRTWWEKWLKRIGL